MEEKEYNVVTLEDGVKYTEIDRIEDDNKVYVFLSNVDNPEDFCVRKLIEQDGSECIIGLDNREEFDRVFNLFTKKYNN